MICSNCGQPLDASKLFCVNCGHLNSNISQSRTPYTNSDVAEGKIDVYSCGASTLISVSLGQLAFVALFGDSLGISYNFASSFVAALFLSLGCVLFALTIGKKMTGKSFGVFGIVLTFLGYALFLIASTLPVHMLGVILIYGGVGIVAGTILHREKNNVPLSTFIGIGFGLLFNLMLGITNGWIIKSFGSRFAFWATLMAILLLGIISITRSGLFENITGKQNAENRTGFLKTVAVIGLFFSGWIINLLLSLLLNLAR